MSNEAIDKAIAALEKLEPLTAYGLVNTLDKDQAVHQQNLFDALQALQDLKKEPVEMTEDEFIDKCLSNMLGGWVPLRLYLKLNPEDTADRVYQRVRTDKWQRRVHYAAPKGGTAWINLYAVRAWIESEGEATTGEPSTTGQPGPAS